MEGRAEADSCCSQVPEKKKNQGYGLVAQLARMQRNVARRQLAVSTELLGFCRGCNQPLIQEVMQYTKGRRQLEIQMELQQENKTYFLFGQGFLKGKRREMEELKNPIWM